MNIINLPVSILDNIINNINDTDSYANLRLSCKSCFYLMRVIKRRYHFIGILKRKENIKKKT